MPSRGARRNGARKPLVGESHAEFRSCDCKKRYASAVEAKKAAKRGARRKDAPQLFVYHCGYCGGWHLTHRKPNR